MHLEIHYVEPVKTKKYSMEYFKQFKIHLKEIDFNINATSE